ncbi:MAG: acetate/propionate family kinase [Kiritimatiellae bacterium]|nr:acetate/propionate family kinase [Kiritimatiellia bacterium]
MAIISSNFRHASSRGAKAGLHILVFNCGSSSLSYKIFRTDKRGKPEIFISGKAHRVGVKGSKPSFIVYNFKGKTLKDVIPLRTHQEAARLVFDYIRKNNIKIDLIGNRFVHGGILFDKSAFIDADNLKKLQSCLPLAPIHNPIAMSVIRTSQSILPEVRQYAAFDSAFHAALPPVAYTYPLPGRVVKKFAFRKYGFHGLSYLDVTGKTAAHLKIPADKLKMIICHLGTGGSSIAAIRRGRSIDTSMGYSPLTGLVMSTRCGDIDPMLAIYLMTTYGYRPDYLLDMLEKRSGLIGLSGFSSDLRDIIEKKDKKQAKRAFGMYIHRLKEYLGSYVAVLGGLDALVFTDDIGVQNWLVREKVCENMGWSGIVLDKDKNRAARSDQIVELHAARSALSILSVPNDEERIICLEGLKLLERNL